jgi:DnaJ-class molecular chaperone
LKPSTTHRLICPKCKTTFYVHVKKDLGIVVLLKDEYKKSLCPDCKGTGKCSTCKGTGEMICPNCGGHGWFLKSSRISTYHVGTVVVMGGGQSAMIIFLEV